MSILKKCWAWFTWRKIVGAGLAGVLLLALAWQLFLAQIRLDLPIPENTPIPKLERTVVADQAFRMGQYWLRKNDHDLWEMSCGGSGLNLGLIQGQLSQELMFYQEQVFIDRIQEMIPSAGTLTFLKYFTAWFNRHMDQYVPQDLLQEIYGVSTFASPKFDVIGPSYQRHLNYHAAHDIGHAMQNMNLVACTGLAAWGASSPKVGLMVARNFDFHVNEAFAKNKILNFVKPDRGYAFVSLTFAGMIGVLSGMNETGLTVSLNAAKSEIPSEATMPVSLLARQILQHAKNIEEALQIAKSSKTFVAESFLIGSKNDGRAVIIEKSVEQTECFESSNEVLIQTNHFQSSAFKDRVLTQQNIKDSASLPRWQRVQELLQQDREPSPQSWITLLRDDKGLGGKDIGLSNELAINQYIAHHSIIFLPESLEFWVSTAPYQMGSYLKYNLKHVLAMKGFPESQIYEAVSEPDPRLKEGVVEKIWELREIRQDLIALQKSKQLASFKVEDMEHFVALNPNYYETWYWKGCWHLSRSEGELGKQCLEKALSMDIPREVERRMVKEALGEK